MAEFFDEVASEHPQINVRHCYSRPSKEDQLGQHYHYEGRLAIDYIRNTLPNNDYDFYICGPGPMMADTVHGLEDWGVAPEKIHFEAFGPSTVKRRIPLPVKETGERFTVVFAKSKKDVVWAGQAANLLELGESAGLTLPFGCRAGVCGMCRQSIEKGEIAYESPPAADPGKGACLLCKAKPESDLVLKA